MGLSSTMQIGGQKLAELLEGALAEFEKLVGSITALTAKGIDGTALRAAFRELKKHPTDSALHEVLALIQDANQACSTMSTSISAAPGIIRVCRKPPVSQQPLA